MNLIILIPTGPISIHIKSMCQTYLNALIKEAHHACSSGGKFHRGLNSSGASWSNPRNNKNKKSLLSPISLGRAQHYAGHKTQR
jgi:hypothetical protein